jgi:radical SAM protein with 4Fe4S-binding SPASM domain
VIQLAHRLVLTEKCNLACPHCFNAEDREFGVMDADIIIRFMRENSDSLRSSALKIMGGEPTIHPRMLEITREACQHYGEVKLFTNGSTMQTIVKDPDIMMNHFRGKLLYTINGFTFNIDKFLEYKDYINFVILHFVVPLNNPEKMIEKIEKCIDLSPKVSFIISPDTQVDLFNDFELKSYRTTWVGVLSEIIPPLTYWRIPFSYDHRLPICFYTQEMIDELHSENIDTVHLETITCCGEQYMGLIDHNFDLYYCNQTRIKLGSILDDDGNPKSIETIHEMIQVGSRVKLEQIIKLSDKCKNCTALPVCKVGCYYNILRGKQS